MDEVFPCAAHIQWEQEFHVMYLDIPYFKHAVIEHPRK